MTTFEREMSLAHKAGADAARKGNNQNPHKGAGDKASERVLAIMWRRGFQSVSKDMPITQD